MATRAALDHRYTFYGGSRGPGKSYWLRWFLILFLIRCWTQHRLRGVTVGLFCETYPQLRDRQITKLAALPHWLGQVHETAADGLCFFLNDRYGGGKIALRNLDDPTKYQSAEFAAVGVEELTRNPPEVFHALRGSLRWPGLEHTPFVAAGNPGGIGHTWVKGLWIDSDYPPELAEDAAEFAYVRALPDDNPHLSAAYWHMLDTLPPDLKRAWRHGDWDVFEGMAFSEWRRDRHVILPLELPRQWPRWRAVDWGRNNPFCCLWFCLDPDTHRVYVYREVYETQLTDRQQAALILANTPPGEKINVTYADPSMWTKKTHEDTTFSTADEYRAAGVKLEPADNERITGKRKVDTLLAKLPDGLPGLLVFESCTNLARTLGGLPYDELNVEDVDTAAEDHAYDALRYGLSRIKPRAATAPAATRLPTDVLLARLGGGKGLGSKDL